jgi:glutaredoxin 3
MSRVKVYSTGVCPFCDKAKMLLRKWQIPFEEIRIDVDQAARREFIEVTNGARTVPQIVIDGKCIGGFTELTELHMEDKLDHLVQA